MLGAVARHDELVSVSDDPAEGEGGETTLLKSDVLRDVVNHLLPTDAGGALVAADATDDDMAAQSSPLWSAPRGANLSEGDRLVCRRCVEAVAKALPIRLGVVDRGRAVLLPGSLGTGPLPPASLRRKSAVSGKKGLFGCC